MYKRVLRASRRVLQVDKRVPRVRKRVLTQLTFTCSKLTMKTPERRQWSRSGIFIVNFNDAVL